MIVNKRTVSAIKRSAAEKLGKLFLFLSWFSWFSCQSESIVVLFLFQFLFTYFLFIFVGEPFQLPVHYLSRDFFTDFGRYC